MSKPHVHFCKASNEINDGYDPLNVRGADILGMKIKWLEPMVASGAQHVNRNTMEAVSNNFMSCDLLDTVANPVTLA